MQRDGKKIDEISSNELFFWIFHPLNNYAVSNRFWNMIEYYFELILVEKILRGRSADVLDEICKP